MKKWTFKKIINIFMLPNPDLTVFFPSSLLFAPHD